MQLARTALERLVDTKDRAILVPIRDQLRITRSASAVLLRVLHRFSPRPDSWTEVLLDHTASADRDTASTAWSLLGDQNDPASLAVWTPRAAAALSAAGRREDAMRALGAVAGRTATGLKELSAVAVDVSAPEELRLRAIRILGDGADTHASGHAPDVTAAARAQWLATCEPVLKGAKPGKFLEACLSPSSSAIPDGKERARYLASWLSANPDPAVKVEYLGRLESLWSEAFDVTDTVRAELGERRPAREAGGGEGARPHPPGLARKRRAPGAAGGLAAREGGPRTGRERAGRRRPGPLCGRARGRRGQGEEARHPREREPAGALSAAAEAARAARRRGQLLRHSRP